MVAGPDGQALAGIGTGEVVDGRLQVGVGPQHVFAGIELGQKKGELAVAVADFRKRGLKIGSTTGYTGEMMKLLLGEAKKRGYEPDSSVCATDVPAGRPEPWMCLQNAMNLQTYPMEAFVKIGDTLPDISEGLNAHKSYDFKTTH